MIPLNKPGHLGFDSNRHDFIAEHFQHKNVYYTSTASGALNIIYKKLYEDRGSLRIGVSPLTCFEAIYPIVINGHTPVFLDIDTHTFNLDTRLLAAHDDLQALQVIHLGGNPNNMDSILAYSKERCIPVIEDCAQALGATYKGLLLGYFGNFAAFSLIKNLHVPSGGLLLSNEDLTRDLVNIPTMGRLLELYRVLKIWLESKTNHKTYNIWNGLYSCLMSLRSGTNAPTNISTSILREQTIKSIKKELDRFDCLLSQRLKNAERIISRINPSQALVQHVLMDCQSNRNRILLKLKKHSAISVITSLRSKGIAANNLTQSYRNAFQPHVSKDNLLGKYYSRKDLEGYDSVFPYLIAIPSSPFLTEEEIEHINCYLDMFIS